MRIHDGRACSSTYSNALQASFGEELYSLRLDSVKSSSKLFSGSIFFFIFNFLKVEVYLTICIVRGNTYNFP